jgi:hypothetical protein
MTNSPPAEAQNLALDPRKQPRDFVLSGCLIEFFNSQLWVVGVGGIVPLLRTLRVGGVSRELARTSSLSQSSR